MTNATIAKISTAEPVAIKTWLPRWLWRDAKAAAAKQEIPLKDFFAQALMKHLGVKAGAMGAAEKR